MTRPLSPLAIVLGLGGLIPFVVCGLGAMTLGSDGALRSLLALIAYGATILAFLGGVHWGLALYGGAEQTERVSRARFGLGVVPSLIGWAGLLVAFVGLPHVGAAVLLAGFIGTIIVEARANQAGLMPAGYMALRWALTAGAVLCLGCVLIARVLGAQIIL